MLHGFCRGRKTGEPGEKPTEQGPVPRRSRKAFGPENHNKNLKPYVTVSRAVLAFSHNFNTNKVNFHVKFDAYTLLSFLDTDH